MYQAQTTYQSDYTPFDWLQNNLVSDMTEFCSPDNIDDCLKYISQEFCALGYPSIYSNSSDGPLLVNCDLVTLLNSTFELLRNFNQHIQVKEDLEDKNNRLTADLNVHCKKNSQLKNVLEQVERKLSAALEKERQLKERNEQLSQQLKTEKEESKKLSAQIRQQKVAHQHEVRKYENSMNHVKTKLNQLLSDKNPNKKISNISMSQTLPRSTGQRGKWKTGSSATSAIEEMYNSVIASYETRCKDMCKELNSFRQCLQSVIVHLVEIASNLKEEENGNSCSSNEFILNEMKKESRNCNDFDEKFKYLLSILDESAKRNSPERCRSLENEVTILKLKISEFEKILEENKESQSIDKSQNCTNSAQLDLVKDEQEVSPSEKIKKERLQFEEEKQAFLKSLQKEKAELSSEKLALLRLAMLQKNPPQSAWHHSLNTMPSLSVITSRNGVSRISGSALIKSSSSPDQNELISPDESSGSKNLQSKSDSLLVTENWSTSPSFFIPPASPPLDCSQSDLPSWATRNSEAPIIIVDDTPNCQS